MSVASDEYPDPEPFAYVGSTVGNARFSGLNIRELYNCMRAADTVEEFDAAVAATIRLKEITCAVRRMTTSTT